MAFGEPKYGLAAISGLSLMGLIWLGVLAGSSWWLAPIGVLALFSGLLFLASINFLGVIGSSASWVAHSSYRKFPLELYEEMPWRSCWYVGLMTIPWALPVIRETFVLWWLPVTLGLFWGFAITPTRLNAAWSSRFWMRILWWFAGYSLFEVLWMLTTGVYITHRGGPVLPANPEYMKALLFLAALCALAAMIIRWLARDDSD